MTGKDCGDYVFTMTVSPLDCMGCGVCVGVCPAPGKALKMVPQESQLAQQDVFDYCVANVGKKPGMMAETTVKGSQFNQPLLEFSGSCAGCAETSYARLITQLFGERMFISNEMCIRDRRGHHHQQGRPCDQNRAARPSAVRVCL